MFFSIIELLRTPDAFLRMNIRLLHLGLHSKFQPFSDRKCHLQCKIYTAKETTDFIVKTYSVLYIIKVSIIFFAFKSNAEW